MYAGREVIALVRKERHLSLLPGGKSGTVSPRHQRAQRRLKSLLARQLFPVNPPENPKNGGVA
jgi:hypothetical protein